MCQVLHRNVAQSSNKPPRNVISDRGDNTDSNERNGTLLEGNPPSESNVMVRKVLKSFLKPCLSFARGYIIFDLEKRSKATTRVHGPCFKAVEIPNYRS